MIVPLEFADDLDLQIRLRAFPMPGEAADGDHRHGGGPLRTAAGRPPNGRRWRWRPRAGVAPGANRVVLTFSSMGRPADGRDPRDLWAAVDYVRVQIRPQGAR